jgi:hypothetical protein
MEMFIGALNVLNFVKKFRCFFGPDCGVLSSSASLTCATMGLTRKTEVSHRELVSPWQQPHYPFPVSTESLVFIEFLLCSEIFVNTPLQGLSHLDARWR